MLDQCENFLEQLVSSLLNLVEEKQFGKHDGQSQNRTDKQRPHQKSALGEKFKHNAPHSFQEDALNARTLA
jgi:hypothetical protein